jgi:hypothetical protein
MTAVDWKLRARLFLQRLLQPTCACMFCMTAPTFVQLASLPHWKIALQTGVGTGVLALLLSFTAAGKLFRHRYGNALVMGALTAVADAWSHPGRLRLEYGEAILTGVVSALIVLATSYIFEDRARRVRQLWSRLRGARASQG